MPLARAEPEAPAQTDDEVRAPGTVEPTPVEKPPVKPKPKPKPKPKREYTGTISIGADYSSDEGFIAASSAVQPDLFHTGLYLGMFARISAQRMNYMVRFADPHLFGGDLALSTDLYADDRMLPGFKRKAVGISPTLSAPLGRHLRAFVGYRLEEIDVEATAPIVGRGDKLTPRLRGGVVSALRTGLEYDSLAGTRIGASIEHADPRLGSDLDLTTVKAWANTHKPVGPFTLHLGGAVTAIASPDGVPLNERLFLDSSSEVRGYRAFSLGPVDSFGRPIGGDFKLTGSAELELPLVRRVGLSAVGFFDAGAIVDRSGRGETGRSVGVGLLWHSPIGPLHFDWAFPLDGSKPAFIFGIGAPF